MQCPVTGASAADGAAGECPVIHKFTDHSHSTEAPPVAVEEIDENPSMAEYKRLRKVMGQITKFYRDGSELKRRNMEGVSEQIAKLEVDERMAQAQLAVLDSTPGFKIHPKAKEYRRPLRDEVEGLQKQKDAYQAKHKEFQDLFEWSKTIVQICEWLEANLDDYCSKKLELPQKIVETLQPPRELNPDEVKAYSRGLDEIVYNLQESQDFFAASVDGRLNKYHNVEKALIEAQLEALKAFPEDSDRRLFITAELEKDLDYVMGNMALTPEVEKRRHKMLRSHQEYLHVLRYQREKLQALNVDLTEERKFDSRFDLYRDD
eukprot:TRINITY_DN2556_c0_g1_i1.p2 TRINITY_DN2556_c0_g1~~TRINITY_DN2556_c0_g1_i1.p2  ORF type:complete len:319 (+),score=136.37 TRINITY_DN2556_c0_g1_i1:112-1068(+)